MRQNKKRFRRVCD